MNQPPHQMQPRPPQAIRHGGQRGGLQRIEGRCSITVLQSAAVLAAGYLKPYGGIALTAVTMVDGIGKEFLDDQLHALQASLAHTGGLGLAAQVTQQLGQGGKARRNDDFGGSTRHNDQQGGTNVIKTYCIAGLVSIALAGNVWAQNNVAGMVKHVRGAVTIERGSEKLPATVGAPLQVADKVRTGADGAVGLTLKDHTLLSAGPNSLLSLDKFSFDSTTHDGKMSVGVKKGTVSVATGKIARKTPESVEFHTPTTMLGVRGTEFVIEVANGEE